MATYSSDLATEQATAIDRAGSSVKDGTRIAGELKTARCTYTLDGTEVDTETLNLVKLPAGAIVLPGQSTVRCASPGTLVCDIGDTTDVNGAADGLALSAGGTFTLGELEPYQFPSQDWLTLTFAATTDTSSAVGVVIYVEIVYVSSIS